MTEGVLMHFTRLTPQHQGQHIHRHLSHLTDGREAGAAESKGGLWSYAGKPMVGQRLEKALFLSRMHLMKGSRFVQLGGDLADQFVRPHPFADGDFVRIMDGATDDVGNFEG